jgi:hypothetical protein
MLPVRSSLENQRCHLPCIIVGTVRSSALVYHHSEQALDDLRCVCVRLWRGIADRARVSDLSATLALAGSSEGQLASVMTAPSAAARA